MSTDLQQHIQQSPLCDTHEHLRKEAEWVENGPADVLQDLFTNYVPADLVSAGASAEAMTRLQDSSDGDLAARFDGVSDAWEAIRHTGYGEAVRILGEDLYGLQEWTGDEFSRAGDPAKEIVEVINSNPEAVGRLVRNWMYEAVN